MGVACRNLEFIRWVRSCCPGQAEFKAFVPANFSGWPSKNAMAMLWYEFWELCWRVCQSLLSSSNLPPTFFGSQWLSCGRSAASDHCRGPGLARLSLAHCNMSTSGRRLVDLHLPLSTVWEWASPTKVRATCFANECRWWFPGGLHCWWGLCLHLQFGTERQAEALVWFRFENMHFVNSSQWFHIPLRLWRHMTAISAISQHPSSMSCSLQQPKPLRPPRQGADALSLQVRLQVAKGHGSPDFQRLEWRVVLVPFQHISCLAWQFVERDVEWLSAVFVLQLCSAHQASFLYGVSIVISVCTFPINFVATFWAGWWILTLATCKYVKIDRSKDGSPDVGKPAKGTLNIVEKCWTHFRVFSFMVLTVLAYLQFEAKNSICSKFRIALDDSKVTEATFSWPLYKVSSRKARLHGQVLLR